MSKWENLKSERLGEENYNIFGTLMKIVKYNNNKDIIVEFQDEYKARVHTEWKHFKIGNVKNPYDKDVFNIGYIGIGKYATRINKKETRCYSTWHSMLQRCYDPYFINKQLTYKDCFVCKEWHCFQNFAEWYEKNYYEIENEVMELDKDILYKGNKIYSPEKCIFVPKRINQLLLKSNKIRGKYPIGVSYHYNKERDWERLKVRCGTLKKSEFLGYFPLNRPFQAFTVYKQFKESYIKQVADEYKDLIPQKLYEALYRYEVEIND